MSTQTIFFLFTLSLNALRVFFFFLRTMRALTLYASVAMLHLAQRTRSSSPHLSEFPVLLCSPPKNFSPFTLSTNIVGPILADTLLGIWNIAVIKTGKITVQNIKTS